MTIFVFFLGALLGFFWLLLLQTLFWNPSKSDSRSHYQKVNKVSDNHWFFLLPTKRLLLLLYWTIVCLCYGGLCVVAFRASESFLAFVWLTSAFLLSLTDLIDYSVYPQLLYPAHLLLALAQLRSGASFQWLSLGLLVPLVFFVWQEKMGGGDLLVLAGWSTWLAPKTLLALLLVASSLGLLAFFSYQSIWKKRLAQLPFVPFLSLGLLIVRFLAFHTFDGLFL
ncbi:prepilin peptidase [Enterococcus casseliflavus]|uniref:prepilin peptidase n=1 Tax=Enterococcus casseliflavus TaxID=37734 RepID=UPI0039A565A8